MRPSVHAHNDSTMNQHSCSHTARLAHRTLIVSTLCEREERPLSLVAAVLRLRVPTAYSALNASGLVTTCCNARIMHQNITHTITRITSHARARYTCVNRTSD